MSITEVYVNGMLYQLGHDVTEVPSSYCQKVEVAGMDMIDPAYGSQWQAALDNSGVTAQYLCLLADLGLGGFGKGRSIAQVTELVANQIETIYWDNTITGFDLNASDVINVTFNYSPQPTAAKKIKIQLYDTDGNPLGEP